LPLQLDQGAFDALPISKMCLIGRLGKDFVEKTPAGYNLLTSNLAVNQYIGDESNGSLQATRDPEW